MNCEFRITNNMEELVIENVSNLKIKYMYGSGPWESRGYRIWPMAGRMGYASSVALRSWPRWLSGLATILVMFEFNSGGRIEDR